MRRRSPRLPSRRGKSGSVALGTTIPSGYAVNVPEDIGVHAQITAAWYREAGTPRRRAGTEDVWRRGGTVHARGQSPRTSATTLGALGGAGLDLGRAGHGVQLDVPYHYLPNAFRTLTDILTRSIGFRFSTTRYLTFRAGAVSL